MMSLTTSDEGIEQVKQIAGKVNSKELAFTYISPKDSAIKAYKINTAPEVKNTIFVYKDMRVVAKFVNLKADTEGLAKLNRAIDQIDR